MLEVEGIASGYASGPDVLHDASIRVGDKEVVALVGLNGAGKSTLVRTLAGLLPARRGTVTWEGDEITRATSDERARRGIMLVPEGRELCLPMTVRENLAMGTLPIPRRDRRRLAAESEELVMGLFPVLGERRRQVVGTLSGGQQQMLAIARALMARPRLLILDEPSLGLAPQLVGQIFDSLAQLNQQGLAILLVEQNAAIALAFSTHAYSLDLGRVTPGADQAAHGGALGGSTPTARRRREAVALPDYTGIPARAADARAARQEGD